MQSLTDFYDDFKSLDRIKVAKISYFTDKDGYLNEAAFRAFSQRLLFGQNEEDYYLLCMNVDLRLSNAKSLATGDWVLRRFIASLDGYFVFRIQGEKFNALLTKEQIPHFIEILEKPSDQYKIYYGIVKEKPFKPQSPNDAREMIRKGITLMYEKKGERFATIQDSGLHNLGNTPKEMQETKLRKFRSTMWCSTVTLTITEPLFKEVTIYIYPTEYKEPLVSLPIIAAVYDKVNYNIKYGSNVKFGIEGLRFTATCRFDRDEHLTTAILAQDKCTFDFKTTTNEGICIPATFGKRIKSSKGIKEIYPLRKNVMGYFDYVMLDDGEVSLNTEGCITMENGVTYGVLMDDEFVDLVQIS